MRFPVPVAPLDHLRYLVRGEFRLAANFDALGLRIGSAAYGTLVDPALRRAATNRLQFCNRVMQQKSAIDSMPRPCFIYLELCTVYALE